MNTIRCEVLEEFHYAIDGKNASRKEVGTFATIRFEDEERLAREGKIKSNAFPGPDPEPEAKGRRSRKAAKAE